MKELQLPDTEQSEQNKPNKRRIKCLGGCLLLVVLFFFPISGCMHLYNYLIPSHALRALPASATEVNEYYWHYGAMFEWIRVVKARVTEDEYLIFAKNIGFQDIDFTEDIGHGLKYSFPEPEKTKWWNPPDSTPKGFIRYIRSDYVQIVTYYNGYLYFYESES